MITNKKLETEVLNELSKGTFTTNEIQQSLKVWKLRQIQDCLLRLTLKKVVKRENKGGHFEYVYEVM